MLPSLDQFCTYQGSKRRLASRIVDAMWPIQLPFNDLCCGTASVAMEAINRGIPPSQVYLVDAGPWGIVWEWMTTGRFDMRDFMRYYDEAPEDPADFKKYLLKLKRQPAYIDTPYVFILLQCATFGGSPQRIEGNSWSKSTGPKKKRKPEDLPYFVGAACRALRHAHGIHGTVEDNIPLRGSAYFDPPYQGTRGYGSQCDVQRVITSCHIPLYVSESKPLSPNNLKLSGDFVAGRGVCHGPGTLPIAEYLSAFNTNRRLGDGNETCVRRIWNLPRR